MEEFFGSLQEIKMADFYLDMAWEFLKKEGFKKKGKNFYKSSDEVALVINFQKSNFGEGYYINFGAWIKSIASLSDDTAIKDNQCHIAIRMESLLPDHAYIIRCLADKARLRAAELQDLNDNFHKIFDAGFKEKMMVCLTVAGLKRIVEAGEFSKGLVRKEARDHLASLA